MTAPTLLTIARRALDGEAKVERGTTLLVAVSGGPDSMALLDVVAKLAAKRGVGVFAHGVDHGLRAGAARELDGASELAEALDVPFARTRVTVPRGGNLQARARAARWEALAAAARACRAHAIATAHHADDRAETLLMRLLRGAGPRGLAVLPPRAPVPLSLPRDGGGGADGGRSIDVVRPLLRARRADVLAHLVRHRIPFASDPSNHDPHFLRVRVRKEVLPLLAELDPRIVHHLGTLADDLGRLDAVPGATPLPRATQEAIADLLRSGSTSARLWLPGGLVVQRRKGS